MAEAADVTQVLQAIGRSEQGAAERLLVLVYAELRRLAAARMAHELADQTLQATALVHEAWLRRVKDGDRTWQNRAHFLAPPRRRCDGSWKLFAIHTLALRDRRHRIDQILPH